MENSVSNMMTNTCFSPNGMHFIPNLFTSSDLEGGTGGPDPPPPTKNHKNIGFLSNTGPDPLKNHKATKPTFNVGPTSARQQNAI